ncbi:MAG: prepilin-type N-terminal cleavage/methylation domain-containing protein [Candidatus Doudnabacteria bacterium]|nr:prepilin-type N-terminal cleavage/methylation domain-containing protein [Candidatus Doudnabacteria bacterium]
MKNFDLKFNWRRKSAGSQNGQTLIETMAALFILVMGIAAATGLAVYAFGASTNINKQIIATGLARESLEAVRNMRDTNWMNDSLVSNGCYNFASTPIGQITSPCYQNWLGRTGSAPFNCIFPDNNSGNSCSNNGAPSMTYTLGMVDPSTSSGVLWYLQKQKTTLNYGMSFSSTTPVTGFYTQDGNTPCNGSGATPADYCRKIVITNFSKNNGNATGQYSQYGLDDNLSLLEVQSMVWWVDKKCPRAADFAQASPTCRVELDTYLTNWKDF